MSDPCCLSPSPCPFIDYTSLPVPKRGILVTVSPLILTTEGDSFRPLLSFSVVLLKMILGFEGFGLVHFAVSALPFRVTLETVLLVHQTKPRVWKVVWVRQHAFYSLYVTWSQPHTFFQFGALSFPSLKDAVFSRAASSACRGP